MGCIYRAKNTVNGMCYVGKTENTLAQRKVEHKCEVGRGAKSLLHRALREYGWDAFEWDILTERDDAKELILCEIGLISILQTKDPHGYNMSDGGEGMKVGDLEFVKNIKVKEESQRKKSNVGQARQRMGSAFRRRELAAEQMRRRANEQSNKRVY